MDSIWVREISFKQAGYDFIWSLLVSVFSIKLLYFYLGFLTAQLTSILASFHPCVSAELSKILSLIFRKSLSECSFPVSFSKLDHLVRIVETQLNSKGQKKPADPASK